MADSNAYDAIYKTQVTYHVLIPGPYTGTKKWYFTNKQTSPNDADDVLFQTHLAESL